MVTMDKDFFKEADMDTVSDRNAAAETIDRDHESAVQAAEPAATATRSIDSAATMAHKTVDTVAEAARPAAEWLVQQGKDAVHLQKKLMDDACTYVAANPWKAVAIAAAAGFLVGHLVRSRDGGH